MRISVLAIGRMKAGPESDLAARYAGRFAKLARGLGFSGPDIVELPESRMQQADERKSDEAARLVARIPDRAFVMALDETGKAMESEAFAALIGQERDQGCGHLAIVIGGADGHGPALLARADRIVSMGRMTWPHQLARILILEQVYRAATILSGHPYHKS